MSDWRERLLRDFVAPLEPLTLVADPDRLLTDESLQETLTERGFDLLTFDDPVTFRFSYESRYRSHWDRGEPLERAVVLRTDASDLASLPHDVWQAGRHVSCSLGELFPHLSYPIVALLERGDLDALYRAQEQHSPMALGGDATRDFVLAHVFRMDATQVQQPPDVLEIFLRWHYRGLRLPPAFDERLIEQLRRTGQVADWPLEQIVPDRAAFFAFLQERWPIFLDRLTLPDEVRDPLVAYEVRYPGPWLLPFDHEAARVYIDTLFLEGLLQPVAVSSRRAARLATQWVAVGIRATTCEDRTRRLDGLLGTLEGNEPSDDAPHHAWLETAGRWAEIMLSWHAGQPFALSEISAEAIGRRVRTLRTQIDEAFLAWAKKRYGGLSSQPGMVMVHHIPRVLARYLTSSGPGEVAGQSRKVALIVVDGLALDQWLVTRTVLSEQRPDLLFRDSAVFAWAPTITSVSRQAIFAGKPPFYFASSIMKTGKEPTLWSRFWEDHGVRATDVGYLKGLGADGSLQEVEHLLAHASLRVVGLVVETVDRILHGMELGSAGMHNQVRQWSQGGFLAGLIDRLLESGYGVFLTSDHGNIEARGCGSPAEGAIADVRGQRVRIYPDEGLRNKVAALFPFAVPWPQVGLPTTLWPLLAPEGSAFVSPGDRVVAHGGLSVEESIVPFIQIEARRRDTHA